MIIDVFNHFIPPKYFQKMIELAPNDKNLVKRMQEVPAVADLEVRRRQIDLFKDYVQILSLPGPPVELVGPSPVSAKMARIANDGFAELVQKYPDQFPAFIASLPMNDPQGLLEEAKRAIQDLGAVGVQIFSNVLGQPLDNPDFSPFFDLMAEYNIPIFLHPARAANFSDYKKESKSLYEIWWAFGWPYETSAAMARLVFSGLFDKHPQIKIITHHLGGMIPYFAGRVGPGWDQLGSRTNDVDYSQVLQRLQKRPLDYFHMFYADTALNGDLNATQCGVNFFGADKVLFASDAPFDPEMGTAFIRWTIDAVNQLEVSEDDRKAIFEGNSRKILPIKF